MQTMNLKIEDNFFPQFQEMIKNFVKEKKVEVVEDEEYDFENNYPENVVVSSVDEVRRRVYEAEKRIDEGDFITEDEYETRMDKFFSEELGIKR